MRRKKLQSSQRTTEPRNIAVIDIGSSKVKFVVATFRGEHQEKILHREKRLINIGAGLNTERPIVSSEALVTLGSILEDYRRVMDSFDVSSFRVIGTDALRRASNAHEVARIVERATGAKVEILSPQEEARLFFNAVSSEIQGEVAVVDVGGGSVQLTLGNNAEIRSMFLMKTGTVTLQRTFITSDFPSTSELGAVWLHVRQQIRELNVSRAPEARLVYGSTNILDFFTEAGVVSQTTSSFKSPAQVPLSQLIDLYEKIVQHSYADRARFFPSDPAFTQGADLSLINTICLCEALGVNEVIPTNLNLSDALLFSLT
jgi:exopolyphosphatase / guanosine-5'-triphosphate,3'-diphosphate pyrophosphatase